MPADPAPIAGTLHGPCQSGESRKFKLLDDRSLWISGTRHIRMADYAIKRRTMPIAAVPCPSSPPRLGS
jgi:hypothetical protein